MTRIVKFLPFLLLLSIFDVLGQQDPHFSHYMFNNLYTNPGYTGIEGVSRATLIHRSQWLGYQTTNSADQGKGAPTTQMLSAEHPLKLFSSPVVNSGAGFYFTNDGLGPVRNISFMGNFSYHLKLAQTGGTFGFGLKLGIYSQKIDGSILREAESGDDVIDGLRSASGGQTKPDMGLGVWYNTARYYAGISLNHINKSTFDFKQDVINSDLSRHMYITGGYNIFLNSILITPSAIIQTDFAETNFNYGAVASMNKYKYWLGFTLRQSVVDNAVEKGGKQINTDDIVILAGLSLLPKNELRIGYAFDIVTSGAAAKNNTSHEIMVSYVLPFNDGPGQPPIRTPRYRHEN